MRCHYILAYRLSVDQVFLNDALEYSWCAVPVPRALRVDECNRPVHAYLQAVSFAAIDTALTTKLQFIQAALQIIP